MQDGPGPGGLRVTLRPITEEWIISDGWIDGGKPPNDWYIVRPDGEYAGPFSEEEAARLLPEFKRRYDTLNTAFTS